MVQGKMSIALKFLDNSVLYTQGNKCFKECLAVTQIDIDERPDQHGLEKEFFSCAQHYLNKHMCHVCRTIREVAACKYCGNVYCL
jgi:hypothetical protein